ncbi:MAG TPA: SBBP repeat-containing protein [candidate division Zixibacteria bacterium]|nr:SBBP repeat-containing protein [candidate division Zixibacteria bacterium]
MTESHSNTSLINHYELKLNLSNLGFFLNLVQKLESNLESVKHMEVLFMRHLKLAAVAVALFLAVTFISAMSDDLDNAGEDLSKNTRMKLSHEELKQPLFPLYFTENQGQFGGNVLFKAKSSKATVWLQKDAVTYHFIRKIKSEKVSGNTRDLKTDPLGGATIGNEFEREGLAVKTSFVGANANVQVNGEDLLEGVSNYFIGRDQTKWRTNVPNYDAVKYSNIYNGIDLKFYNNGKELEYDFIVKPGSDPEQIVINCEGAKALAIKESGELLMTTDWGDFVANTPIIYQLVNGEKVPVVGQYVLLDNFTYGFKLNEYNREYAVVIDPTQQVYYGTYLGGDEEDEGWDVKVNDCGFAYVVGYTNSDNFPDTVAYQSSLADSFDVFVAKINTKNYGASSLIFSTYFGGENDDFGYGLDIDGDGDIYITGKTESSDFPTYPSNAYDTIFNGTGDGFVAKFNSYGSTLIYSTLFGASGGFKYGYDVGVHSNEKVSVVGAAVQTDMPFKKGFDSVSVYYYGFLLHFNSSGTDLDYATYIGSGTGTGSTKVSGARGIEVRDDIDYVCGFTNVSTFRIVNGFDSTYSGNTDAFALKIDPSDSGLASLLYSTFIGGSSGEYAMNIAVDEENCAYVVGHTSSNNFPDTNAYDDALGGALDGYLAKISANGDSLKFGSYIGGSSIDSALGVAVLSDGSVYVGLQTASSTDAKFKVVNAIHSSPIGEIDTYVAKFNSSLTDLDFASYLGGTGNDEVYAIAALDDNNVYIFTEAASANADTTSTGYDRSFNGDEDAQLIRIAAPDNSLEIRGDANSSGLIDYGDVNFLSAYLFQSGPAPATTCRGDANNSGTINILDINKLNSYLNSTNCSVTITPGC